MGYFSMTMINDTKNKVKAYCAKRRAAKAQAALIMA
jgi:hypothetical protein